MDIDITPLKSREIIKILSAYHSGHLEIKFERVFWCSDFAEPDYPIGTPEIAEANPRRRPPQGGNQFARGFERAADVLGSMVCSPGR
jgi:hypothetical protein